MNIVKAPAMVHTNHQFFIDFPLFIIQDTAEWGVIILEADTRNREELGRK